MHHIILRFLLFVLTVHLSAATVSASNVPVAHSGVIDLSNVDFDESKPLSLKGEWEFYWHQYVAPFTFGNCDTLKAEYMQLPSNWLGQTSRGVEIGKNGWATFRLVINTGSGNKRLKLASPFQSSAAVVYANGKRVAYNGRLGTNIQDCVAEYAMHTEAFDVGPGNLELVVQVANFHTEKGGLPLMMTIGSEKSILAREKRDLMVIVFLLGAFTIMALYHLGLFLIRRKNTSALYFALVCFVLVFYFLHVSMLFEYFFPNVSFEFSFKFLRVNLYLILPVFFIFIRSLFPDELPKGLLRALLIFSAAFIVLVITTPSYIHSITANFYRWFINLGAFLALILVIIAASRRREGARIFITGITLVVLSGINDSLYYMNIINSVDLGQWGLFAMVSSQAYLLASRFSHSFIRTEELTEELRYMNENLENLVRERTAQIEQQKEEIRAQRDEIEQQRDYANDQVALVRRQKQEITDSIIYAKRIQDAVLPPSDVISAAFGDHFVFFKPRNIVSGDFYWFREVIQDGEPIYVIAVADCTGHGVPGSFVSMLGISLLNEVIRKEELSCASQILEELRVNIKSALRQNEGDYIQKDGMDMALCIMKPKQGILEFAGAQNPLYLYRNNVLQEYKGTRSPIGKHIKEKEFKNYTIELEKGDSIYMFSDGFVDQIGGVKRRKFMTRNLKDLLANISNQTMAEQYKIIENTYNEWSQGLSQIDDILVLGLKVE